MIPDVIDKFKGKDEKVVTDADIDAAIEDAAEQFFINICNVHII